ncbi:MAG: glycoside hydrolase family 28 protein [Mangrovibacterium sp.]
MKTMKWILVPILICWHALTVDAKEYNILDYGAKADTSVISTKAIQQAMDECSGNGGGKVVVPAGHFKIGTIILKSNVELHLENGAILFGSRNLEDYIKLEPAYVSLRTQEATIQLIYAENAHNISITGHGEIDGQGRGFEKLSWNDEGITRPHLLRMITCENILIENISLRNSACWMQHYLACDWLQIREVRVFNRNNFNNDALDLDGCRNVTVSDFISDSDDDGITLKSTSPRLCENIAISNCVISSRCNAIKMGTESNGGFRNISINNCVVKPSLIKEPVFFGEETGISAISLEIVDGGVMEGISINNIQIDGTESPIFIRLANRARPYREGLVIDHIGSLGDISLSNIRVKNCGKTGCSITGQPGFPVRNLRLSQIVIDFLGGGTTDDFHQEVAYKPKDYPEATMFGTLPAYGFFVRHAENLTFEGVDLKTDNSDLRPAFFLDMVENCVLRDFHFKSTGAKQVSVYARKSRNLILQGGAVTGESSALVQTVLSSDIAVINTHLAKGTKEWISD